MANERLNIFDYDDYRAYLKDYYQWAKARDKKFSFRYFSRLAGATSPSFLKRTINGERNLTEDGVEKVIKALKLNKEEGQFFYNLVLFNQARQAEEKQKHAEQLLRSRVYKKLHPLSVAQYNYYNHWYFVPVRELVGMVGFKEDPQWIAKKISPAITAAEAQKALNELLRLGLLERDSEGKLKLSSTNVSTGDLVTSASVVQFHREMLKKASESIERHSHEKRDISSVTMGISSQSMAKIKEKLQKFRKEVMQIAAEDSGLNQVYQFNFQLFPLSEKTDEEGGK